MGNIFGGFEALEYRPNIPPDNAVNNGAQNNPNQPCRRQMQDMLLSYAVPSFCIITLAVMDSKSKEKLKKKDNEYMLTVNKLKKALKDRSHQPCDIHLNPFTLAEIEKQEIEMLQTKFNKLKSYDEEIEDILDIHCSLFKDRKQRIVKQDSLMSRLAEKDHDLSNTIKYNHLKDIFNYDYIFCRTNKTNNGKLRQLYSTLWRTKIELEAYQNMFQRLKGSSDKR